MITTEEEALQQLQTEQSKLLDKIDELRTIGVGGLVELPQLIVCGNQSSGKSSVLEAISRVRFPAKSNVCTRFATEVILRRNPRSSIKISVKPGPSRTNEAERERLQAFKPDAFSNGNDLPALIEKAKECMGISDSPDSSTSGFSDDVLKVEISGPDKPELTLVDLPGLYYSTSRDQGAQGIKIVRGLTEKYMKSSRSIILAVISAKADYHLQEVLNIAEQFDPTRERTLGIITQPDTLEPNSEEEDIYLQFVQNKKIPLQLGWHALRNRSFETRDVSDNGRDEREREFFNQGRWASITRECAGIDSLRHRLSNILLKHIRHNLPSLINDIQDKLTECQQRLSKLGAARSSLQQQKGFLLAISSRFERITGQALNGMYADDFFGGLDPASDELDSRRLRAVIRELNEYFAEAMTFQGCRRKIVDAVPKGGFTSASDSQYSPSTSNPYVNFFGGPKRVKRDALERQVGEQARKNRGIELPGSANQLLIGSLFRDQSQPWEGLARRHLMTAWTSVRNFSSLVLQHLTDDHTYQLLFGTVLEPELEKMKDGLLAKLDELTAYPKRGHPLPVGKSFLTQIQKARSDRQLASLKQQLGIQSNNAISITLGQLEWATFGMESSRDEFAASEIIDQMQAYYDTAIVTFVDNVAALGIENCLLHPLQDIFTSQTLNDMDDVQVRELAAEPVFIQQERDRLARDLEKLQAGLRTLNLFNTHKPFLSKTSIRSKVAPARAAAPTVEDEGETDFPTLDTLSANLPEPTTESSNTFTYNDDDGDDENSPVSFESTSDSSQINNSTTPIPDTSNIPEPQESPASSSPNNNDQPSTQSTPTPAPTPAPTPNTRGLFGPSTTSMSKQPPNHTMPSPVPSVVPKPGPPVRIGGFGGFGGQFQTSPAQVPTTQNTPAPNSTLSNSARRPFADWSNSANSRGFAGLFPNAAPNSTNTNMNASYYPSTRDLGQ